MTAQPITALVTGGSRGIGRAIVERLLADGYRVLNLDIQAPSRPQTGETYIALDLADLAATRAAATELAARHPVSCLVNNAGIVRPAWLADTDTDDLAAVMAVNLRAPLLLMQAVLPTMRRQRFGRVVNIASRAALGKAQRSSYAASKAGLLGLTRTWALELAADGITVNAVAPGPIATELFEQVNPPGAPQTEAIRAQLPMRRLGRPAEVAHAVASLLDARAGFITGQVLYVCGGMTVGLGQAA